ncbi:MAG: class I SAM-dependent methyltransferase [Candidatus Acidiferrum sp.]
MLHLVAAANNALVSAISEYRFLATGWRELDEIKEHSIARTDISDHLVTLFLESMAIRPRLIVELGVRTGESTFVFERVAGLCGSNLVSVDIHDCLAISSYGNWLFEKDDDIEFAKRFESWCGQHNIKPDIDVLFIDTSHLFEHTVAEIEHWFPFLSDKSKVIFHDTNLRKTNFRKDGTIVVGAVGRDNKRGVITALEKFFERPFNEKEHFIDWAKGWAIRHYPYCAGLTVLERLQCQRTPHDGPDPSMPSEVNDAELGK